jgi:uncharacterized membrane protein
METIQTPVVHTRYRRISWALAGLIAIGLTLHDRMAQRTRTTDRYPLWLTVGVGALSGLLVPITTVILMLVKISLHYHGVTDFSINDINAVLVRTPIWVVAGLLIGSALGLISTIKRSNRI